MNIKEAFKQVRDCFSPKIIGEINDVYVKIVRINGDEVPWHKHEREDEFFYVIEGNLLFEMEGKKSFTMNEGDFFVVKRGIVHRVSSTEECKVLLVENKMTLHTGNVKTEITKTIEEQLI